MQLYYFRTDLRLQDNTALHHATQQGDTIALYIISQKQWQMHDDAVCKIDLYYRQLQQLKIQLADLNIPLIILNCDLWQDIPQAILTLCQQYQIQQVHCNQEYGLNEKNRDLAIEQLLSTHRIQFHCHHDRTIFPTGSILNQQGEYYKVFGAFKKQCYHRLENMLEQQNLSILPQPKKQKNLNIPSSNINMNDFIAVENQTEYLKHIQQYWQIDEQYALQQLHDFAEKQIYDYHQLRDIPSIHGTSQLSTYLNTGILSIRQCLVAITKNQDSPQLPYPHQGLMVWLDELLWREFYQHLLYGFDKLSRHQPFKTETQHINWRDAPEDLLAWQTAQTGIPIVDAAMRQLLATGWMHNRLRMVVAMFLTKNLLINWRHGERFFMQHLIDGDLAANNGGWQWSASTGTDSVPYFRVFNPISQSQRFDPQGQFIRKWLPELAHLDDKAIHEPYKFLKVGQKLNYPRPIVDLKSSRVRAIDAFKTASEKR
ncbi:MULTISPECIES: deoxyribodipyrimidine photo-lyase [unclassified Acinetobacter]|uniref:deoxyribodipyrimidine photo-lyase n=1 Tax=unclassified Acinetobacter TaxID=196816 RepID=UPI0035BA52F2